MWGVSVLERGPSGDADAVVPSIFCTQSHAARVESITGVETLDLTSLQNWEDAGLRVLGVTSASYRATLPRCSSVT